MVKGKNKKKVTPEGKQLAQRVYSRQKKEYRNSRGIPFSVGEKVRVSTEALTQYKIADDRTARIASLLPDVKGMVVLEHTLGGYWTWDVNDLRKVV